MGSLQLPAIMLARLLAAAVLVSCAPAGIAGAFQVTPTLAEVEAGSSTASFTIRNSGDQPMSVQVEGVSWQQGPQGDRHAPATDLVVVPRIATIPPGRTQLVRVALRGNPRDSERAYRMHFVELPAPPPPGFVGIRTAVKFDIPLFFLAADGASQVEWSATLSPGGALVLDAANRGGRYARMTSLRVVDERGAVLAERKGPAYVLAGQAARWELTTHANLRPGDSLRLQAWRGPERDELPLTVE